MIEVVLTVLVAASGWGVAAYLLVRRRQEQRRAPVLKTVPSYPGVPRLRIVRPVEIGSEVGNDDVTKVGVAPTR